MTKEKRLYSKIVLYLIATLLLAIFISPEICTNWYQRGAGQVLLEHHDYLGVEVLEQSIMKQARSKGVLYATLSVLGTQLPFWTLFMLTFETMGSPSGKKKKILTGCYWFTWLLGMFFLSFFIPYRSADFPFPQSIMISAFIYLVFSVIAGFIYMILKYLFALVKKTRCMTNKKCVVNPA